MRLLVLIFAYFVASSCGVEIPETSHVPLDFGASRTSGVQNPGAETSISSIYLTQFGNISSRTRNETLNLNSSIENSLRKVDAHNCSSTREVDPDLSVHNSAPNGNVRGKHSNRESNQNATIVSSSFSSLSLSTTPFPSKSNLSTKNLSFGLADSMAGDKIAYLSKSNATKLKNVSYEAQPKPILPSKRSQLDSANFISREKMNSISNYRTVQNLKEVTKDEYEGSLLLKTSTGNPILEQPISIQIFNESSGFRDSNSSVEDGSLISSEDVAEIQQNSGLVRDSSPQPVSKKNVNKHVESAENTVISVNDTISSHNLLNPNGNEIGDEDPGMSWLDVITSPFVKKRLKHFLTDFYQKSILDTVAKRWNSTRNGTQGQEINSPSVMYPLVMEGVSILVNRLTDDGSNLNAQNESDSVVKGQIVRSVIESLNNLLKSKGEQSQNASPEKSNQFADVKKNLNVGLSQDILNSGILNQLLPLVGKIPRGDLQNTINGLMGIIASNTTNLHQISNASGVDLAGLLSQPKMLSALLQNRPPFTGLSDFQNTSALGEILKKPNVVNSVLGNRSNLSDMGNLTNIMNHFLPKNGATDGISPKNPLLRSDFASKVLAKSPIAHLGALDENIKKLITSSLEKAGSRVRINEKGEIQINEGMKKILGKMIDSDKLSGQNRASDSLMDVLKSAMASGSVRVEAPSQPEDGKPIVRRNVTHHSPLHRKFQEKYGKYYQKSSVEPAGRSHFVLIVLPLIITVFST